jgi:hypothetical protein
MKKYLLLSLFFFSLSNCTTFGNMQGFGPRGILFSNYKVGTSGSVNLASTKVGTSCVHKISFIATFGDGSVEAAATEVGIKRVASVEKEGFGILNPLIYFRLCTIVRGD